MISDRRLNKMKSVVSNRQQMTVILENVHDPHNIGAVMRSCDSVGVQEIFVVYSNENLDEQHLEIGKRSASSAKKWLQVHYFENIESCIATVRKKYDLIYGTHLGESAKSIYNIDLTGAVALMFGNERDGLTKDALSYCDANILIPQVGMIESLNISVACAVSLYEAFRQRDNKGLYGNEFDETNAQQAEVLGIYEAIHKSRYLRS